MLGLIWDWPMRIWGIDSGLENAYERALFLNPRNPRLLTNMGNYYATLAQQASGKDQRRALEQAGSYYRQAIRLNGSYEAPRNGLRYVENAPAPCHEERDSVSIQHCGTRSAEPCQ